MNSFITRKAPMFLIAILVIGFSAMAHGSFAATTPNVQSASVYSISANAATLEGKLIDAGGDSNTFVWFEWGKDSSYANATAPMQRSYLGSFSQTISVFNYNTIYHFRAVAQNRYGISYGQDIVFLSGRSNNLGPVVTAGPNVTAAVGESVTLQGSAYDPYGGTVIYSWKCTGGTVSNPFIAQPVFTPPYVSPYDSNGQYRSSYSSSFKCTLTANNSTGHANSSTMTVTVSTSSLNIQTNAASNIFSTQATLNGYVYTNIPNVNYVWFQWGRSTNYTEETAHLLQNQAGPYSENIADLTPGATYHFRAAGQNIYGTFVYGKDLTVTVSGSLSAGGVSQPSQPTSQPATPSQSTKSTPSTSLASYLRYARKGCYRGDVYWYDSNNAVQGMYQSCSDGNSCTVDICTGSGCTHALQCDGSTCSQGSADYVKYCQTTAVMATGSSTKPESKIITVSLFGQNGSNPLQWEKSLTVADGQKINFLVTVKNTVAAGSAQSVTATINLSDNVDYAGNLMVDGTPSSDNIFTGISLGNIDQGGAKAISFSGVAHSQTQKDNISVIALVKSNAASDSDFFTLNIQPPASSGNTTSAANQTNAASKGSFAASLGDSPLVRSLGHWYVLAAIAAILVGLFIVIFRKLSSAV